MSLKDYKVYCVCTNTQNLVQENSVFCQDLNRLAARWLFSPTRVQFFVERRNPVCDIVWLMIPKLVKSSLMGKIQDQSVSTYVLDSLFVSLSVLTYLTVCLYSHQRLAFSKSCLSAIIAKISYQISWPMTLSCVWDVVFILCFCGASGGSTLLILAFPSINGVTEATQHHLHGYGHPNFSGIAVRFNLWYVDFISGLSCCKNQPLIQLADYQVLFTPSGEDETHQKPFVCGLQYSAGLLCFMAMPLAFVILCGSCSWKNIHGEHRWHRILKYNYALHVKLLFILQSLKCISRMSQGFSQYPASVRALQWIIFQANQFQVWCMPMWVKMLPHITPPQGYFCTIFTYNDLVTSQVNPQQHKQPTNTTNMVMAPLAPPAT